MDDGKTNEDESQNDTDGQSDNCLIESVEVRKLFMGQNLHIFQKEFKIKIFFFKKSQNFHLF